MEIPPGLAYVITHSVVLWGVYLHLDSQWLVIIGFFLTVLTRIGTTLTAFYS